MFSFQQTNDLVFDYHVPSLISFQQPAKNQQDLVVELHDHVITMEDNTNKARKLHGDHSPSSKPNSELGLQEDHIGKDEHTQKKLVHREIERQRRRDMAKLYASLRGLLPLEFVKGKRSTSDHMHEAVNYIKHMQENIKVLSVKRDRLKKLVEAGAPIPRTNNTNKASINSLLPNTVSITSCNGGVQILVNSYSIEDGFPLSRVLNAISDEGCNIVSCTCTKVNQRLIHSIQSEVDDTVLMDISMLQQRLSVVANDY
ncbi:hypothetical protein QVD17_35702 [Tagetes erecta]|uniref:BHLH domain-containing protein n=1 Tax=Tagetes erecta TaxID=13708 RepID=A0AAD8JR96_TARER|nr:hypothetical protein QVD17_35702 [Tagetes erecta]